MATSESPITFVIPGVVQDVAAPRARGGAAVLPVGVPEGSRLKQSVLVAPSRAAGGEVSLTAVPGKDVVVLQILNGPELRLHPEHARLLLLAQSDLPRPRGTREKAPGSVRVPAQLGWRGLDGGGAGAASRGLSPGGVLLHAVHLIEGSLTDKLATVAAEKLAQAVDDQVVTGVYQLEAGSLGRLNEKKPVSRIGNPKDPTLVLLHGTFSETSGTFGKLWTDHPDLVRSLFTSYGGRVFGFDHATLGESPVTNALRLAERLQPDAKVHLLTHSRGGLVAETLARACARADAGSAAAGANGKELAALCDLVRRNRIVIERVVRVACPARGTLLASKRLDAYLSVLKWCMDLAGVPVVGALVDFLDKVARVRTDPSVLPGLAAQIPDSPLLQWLSADGDPIPGELRVVSGDVQGDSIRSWIKTLLADSFYWTDNDLVVQTRSMYGGTPRKADATFLLDQGGSVSHFTYFSNDRTAAAIVSGLTQPTPPDFRTIGPLSWKGESSTGVRAARRAAEDGKTAAEKPAVFLLPGILGSNLKVDDRRIWLSLRVVNGFARLAYHPAGPNGADPDHVAPDGPVDLTYEKLGDFLARSHEVIEFAYDWRRPMEQEASRLARAVSDALDQRQNSGQPVRMVAHSMGGLLARVMQLVQPAVWQRMMSHSSARLLMLGTPNGGSWAPMQTLSCDDTFGNRLVAFGAPLKQREARMLMAAFPGFLQLQAGLLDSRLKLDRHDTWQQLADADLASAVARSWWHDVNFVSATAAWGVPAQRVLDQAVALRKLLDGQRDDPGFVAITARTVLVVGKSRFTPDGYQVTSGGFTYLDAQEGGDGRVTLASAQLPGVRTWQVECDHGKLPAEDSAFPAYLDLLKNGVTDLLPTVSAARGPAPVHVQSRPSRASQAARPPETESAWLAPPQSEPPTDRVSGREPALRVTVHNGDLSFMEYPLLLGHYSALQLTGTEYWADKLVSGSLSEALAAGLYPDSPGTHQVFPNFRAPRDNPFERPRPEAVIVAGLGPESELETSELVLTVRQAVLAWSQHLVSQGAAVPAGYDLGVTLIGSGGVGITVGQSVRSIAQGVREANIRLLQAKWPVVGHLHLIELFLDRATEAWRALRIQEENAPALYAVTATIQQGAGWRRRPLDPNYRGASYDFLSAVSQVGKAGEAAIAYTLDTKRARSEVRAQNTQPQLIQPMLERASNDRNTDRQLGNSLCRLLIPTELDPFFGGTSDLVLELDSITAGIPWELIDPDVPGSDDPRPWAIRAKLIRKLRTPSYRERVTDARRDAQVLVIGDPETGQDDYPDLPGARSEARAVTKLLGASTALGVDRVSSLIRSDDPAAPRVDAQAVINALFQRGKTWRIIHIAGHGAPPVLVGPKPTKPGDPPQTVVSQGGVVLSDQAFLSHLEIKSLRTVPELVVVNCCHLGIRAASAREAGRLGEPAPIDMDYDRPAFAAGVAEELIKIGVRCVIAAGWAVEDAPAEAFATKLYEALLRRERFMDAVALAREAAYNANPLGNTWAAYQCYGDPGWTLELAGGDPQAPTAPPGAGLDAIASPLDLVLVLEQVATDAGGMNGRTDLIREKIGYLEKRYGDLWRRYGRVAQAFGWAWSQAGDAVKAIEWYRGALAANDGRAPIRAAEQLGNQLARQAATRVALAQRGLADALVAAGGVATAPAVRSARQALSQALKAARRQVQEAIELLDRLVKLNPNLERASLCGSAYKRLALIEEAAGNRRAAAQATTRMRDLYALAERLGREQGLSDVSYPALNRIAASLNAKRAASRPVLSSEEISAVRKQLEDKSRADPDFWSIEGQSELTMYEAIDQRGLADKRPSIQRTLADLYVRAPDASRWASVRDQARFVLPRYAAMMEEGGGGRQQGRGRKSTRTAKGAGQGAREAAAARSLLAVIEGYAAGQQPVASKG